MFFESGPTFKQTELNALLDEVGMMATKNFLTRRVVINTPGVGKWANGCADVDT